MIPCMVSVSFCGDYACFYETQQEFHILSGAMPLLRVLEAAETRFVSLAGWTTWWG